MLVKLELRKIKKNTFLKYFSGYVLLCVSTKEENLKKCSNEIVP